jgi:actin-related protein 10
VDLCVGKTDDRLVRQMQADPKARKVIVLENTFMPSYIKEDIAQALFDNLKVRCSYCSYWPS